METRDREFADFGKRITESKDKAHKAISTIHTTMLNDLSDAIAELNDISVGAEEDGDMHYCEAAQLHEDGREAEADALDAKADELKATARRANNVSTELIATMKKLTDEFFACQP